MANRRYSGYDQGWVENPSRERHDDERHERTRNRPSQWNPGENYRTERYFGSSGEGDYRRSEWRGPERHQFEDYGGGHESERFPSEYSRSEPARYRERSSDYDEARPYSSSSTYTGRGDYSAHLDPYRDERERGYGATSTGTEWGSVSSGRHRLGSLTESAAAGAERLSRSVRGNEGTRGYGGYSGKSYSGLGPKSYRRSDERVREEICELLTRSHEVDASNIDVAVSEGNVTLSGTVTDRQSKRVAEDIAQDVWGAKDVQNQIRVESGHQISANEPRTTREEQTSTPHARAASAASGPLGLNTETGRR